MDDRYIENLLRRLKQEIPLNKDLKHSLRRSFLAIKNKGKRLLVLSSIVAAAACFALITYVLSLGYFAEKVYAATLKISNQVSFLDIGQGSSLRVSEHQGTVYMPVAGKGLFAYNNSGFHRIYDREVNFVRVSHDGKRLVISEKGNITIYDIGTKRSMEILRGDNNFIYYEEPSWSPDNNRIVYVKRVIEPRKTHGFTIKESEIYEIDLKNMTTGKKLADGSYPSYVKGTDTIVFEKDNQVILKNLKNKSEKVIDAGRFPAVSPDGNYVAYVKLSQKTRTVGENSSVRESIDNVWIADINLKTSKQVTTNYPHRFIEEKEWVKGLKPGKVPQVLEYPGRYSYYDPVWSSNSESIYMLKNNNTQGLMRLVRIDFSPEKLSPEDTVKRYLQALVERDDDYAKSLMKEPPEILTISNPHQVGYKIIGTGKEAGKDYVDAEIYWGYTANPYYRVVKSRFYLSPGGNGYMIDRIVDQGNVEVSSMDNMNVTIARNGKKKSLFTGDSIPSEYIPRGDDRISSLAYNEPAGTLIFTIQGMRDQEKGRPAYVELLSYNVKNKEFKLIDTISQIGNMVDVGISNLIVDSRGRYAALELFSDNDKTYRSYSYVYDLNKGQKVDLSKLFKNTSIENMHTKFWDENDLVFNITGYGQTVGYVYKPDIGKVFSFSD